MNLLLRRVFCLLSFFLAGLPAQASEPTAAKAPKVGLAKRTGKEVFEKNCAMCHQAQGQGLEGVIPPLAQSDFLHKILRRKDRREWVEIIENGKHGKVTVNGKQYNSIMTGVTGISDEDMTSLLNFVANSWGNKSRPFTLAEVKRYRAKIGTKGDAKTDAKSEAK